MSYILNIKCCVYSYHRLDIRYWIVKNIPNIFSYMRLNMYIYIYHIAHNISNLHCQISFIIYYVTSNNITLYYIVLHYITFYHIVLHYITLHYITLHPITLYYIISHYITLYHIISYYITLYHIIYIILHYEIISH